MSRTVRFTSDFANVSRIRAVTAARTRRIRLVAIVPAEVAKTVASLVETVRTGSVDAPARF